MKLLCVWWFVENILGWKLNVSFVNFDEVVAFGVVVYAGVFEGMIENV